MTEDHQEEETQEPVSEEAAQPVAQPRRPERPQIVEIKTPLDRPEFDWFLNTFMEKMGLQDRKQSAILLSNMFYDMGLDPYSDLKDIQSAMQEMNAMLEHLPNTPTTTRVKDTLGGMFAARAGRTMLDKMPRVTGSDPMMDRMERLMDKYMPLMMTMRAMTDMMKMDTNPQQQQQKATQSEIPESMKAELSALKTQLTNLQTMLAGEKEQDQRKEFAADLTNTILSQVTPQLQALQGQLDALARQPPPPSQPERSAEMLQITSTLKDAVDKLGEKAGAKNVTLDDLDPLLTIIDKIQEKFKKETPGEFDWRVATVSTIGEMGTEAIRAYREVATSARVPSDNTQQPARLGNPEMQAVIKKQVQNYIMARIQSGEGTMNIQEAAQKLGLTPEQVSWAYQTLMAEGWINVKVPQKTEKGAVQTPEQPEEIRANTTEQPAEPARPFSPVEN